MKRHFLILLLLSALVSCTGRVEVVNVADHAPRDCEDFTPVISSILEAHPSGNIRIVFPEGQYHFHQTYAQGKYHAVTNHDNGYKYFAFLMDGMKNVVVDGQGSEFIFHGVITPFLLEDSRDIRLENFTIDWEEPFYIQAQVLASCPEKQTADLRFTGFSKIAQEGNRLNLTNNGKDMHFLGETMVFDPETKAVAYNAQSYILAGENTRTAQVEHLSGNDYRVKAGYTGRPAPEGLIYVFKGPNGSNRLAPAIHVKNTIGFTAANLDIHHAGGMGVIAEKSADIRLDDVNVCLREGSDRIVTTTADATHFCNCGGYLIIENCLFENMLDDATNVHGTYLKVDQVLDGRTVIARLNHPQQFDYDFASEGDEIQIVDKLSILPKGKVKAVSCDKINDVFMKVTFSSDIRDIVVPGDGLENLSWYPELTFRNNVVRNNRARSVLFSSPKKAVIENNSFSSMMTSILFEGDLEHWHESGAVTDIVIRNNVFKDCCYGGSRSSVIWINPHVKATPDNGYYEKNIVIENNEFRSFDRSVVKALSVDGLVFRNNLISPSGTFPSLAPKLAEFEITHCRSLVFTGNTYEGKKSAEILMDSHSSGQSPVIADNTNIVLK